MAGHSHWSSIKHRKAAVDTRRGRLWSKLIRNVIVAAKTGGGSPDANLSLRYAIDKAKQANVPNDTIDRAIKKGTGEIEGEQYEEVVYEGYGPGGVAVMAVCLTDNRNRTGPEIRKIFESRGGSLGSTGCVAWMFEQKGLITVSTTDTDEDRLLEIALEAGAEDLKQEGEEFEIYCPPGEFEAVKNAITAAEIPIQLAEISMIPQSTVKLEGDQAKKIMDLMETLEDHDDTQNVYANFDVPEEVMAEAGN